MRTFIALLLLTLLGCVNDEPVLTPRERLLREHVDQIKRQRRLDKTEDYLEAVSREVADMPSVLVKEFEDD